MVENCAYFGSKGTPLIILNADSHMPVITIQKPEIPQQYLKKLHFLHAIIYNTVDPKNEFRLKPHERT